MIRVAIVEDQGMLRSAVVKLLALEPDITVVAECESGAGVREMVAEHHPDVLLLDIEMPGESGLDIAESLRSTENAPLVVMLTTFARPGYVRRALEAGARAYLTKDASVSAMADVIRQVADGAMLIGGEQLREAMSAGDSPLTARERDVLRAAQSYDTVGEIAEHLHLSVSTVSNHITAAISKAGARNRLEAIRTARDNGWL